MPPTGSSNFIAVTVVTASSVSLKWSQQKTVHSILLAWVKSPSHGSCCGVAFTSAIVCSCSSCTTAAVRMTSGGAFSGHTSDALGMAASSS